MLARLRLPESIAILAALSVCLTTWWPVASHRDMAMMVTPLFLYSIAGALVLAALMAPLNPWLAAFVAWAALRSLVRPPGQALAVVLWLTFGVGLVVLVQRASAAVARGARVGLVVLGAFQAAYALPQVFRWDPLWVGFHHTRIAQVHGTFENARHFGGVMAAMAPLGPWWLVPLFASGVVISTSFLASVAFVAGMAARYCRGRALLLAAPLGAVVLAATVHLRSASTDSAVFRLKVWHVAARDWLAHLWSVVFGYGPGAWFVRVPDLQVAALPGTAPDAFFMGHNDYAQLAYDFGLVGVTCLVGAVIRYRREILASGMLPTLAALAVFSVGLSPLHLPTSATIVCLMVGLALRGAA